jgi:hypothetical protein
MQSVFLWLRDEAKRVGGVKIIDSFFCKRACLKFKFYIIFIELFNDSCKDISHEEEFVL